MGNVILDMAVSLDGFIGSHDGSDQGLHDWYFAPSPASKAVIDEGIDGFGAIVMGKRAYGQGYAESPYNAVNLVVTHEAPKTVVHGDLQFEFVDGIDSALAQAKAAAGERHIAIGGGADIARQFLAAGVVDRIQLHVVAKLLGDGIRLFDTGRPHALDLLRVVDGGTVTHLEYRLLPA